MADAGKVTSDAASLRKEAEERLNDADRNMQDAVNKFAQAFEKPEMVDAIAWKCVSVRPGGLSRATTGRPGVTKTSQLSPRGAARRR